MKCIGKCGKNYPPKDIVWIFGNGEALCRLCFPDHREISKVDRDRQVAAGLPSIAPKSKPFRI